MPDVEQVEERARVDAGQRQRTRGQRGVLLRGVVLGSTARLYLTLDRRGLRLVLHDDGTGPAAPERLFERPAERSGRGLADMRSEATASGGEIDIATDAGGRIDATWPLDRVRHSQAV